MDIAVLGMMRSGTTLVSDLLTVPGRSLVLNEPYLLSAWSSALQDKLHALYRGFGLALPESPPPAGRYRLNQDHFVAEILPQLQRLGCQWGAKYADLHSWRELFASYRPRKLVLMARDLRDVFLSGLGLMNRVGLMFGDRRHLRDEAWLFAFIASTVHELLALKREPHLAIRYEDLVRDEAARASLADYAGLDRLGVGDLNMQRHGEQRAGWERAKHDGAITARSVGRFDCEPAGPMRAHAERLWRLFPEYGEAFGYEVPRPVIRVAVPGIRAAEPGAGANPVDYGSLNDWRWVGPASFEPVFGARAARLACAARVRKPLRVFELGAGTRAFWRMLPDGTSISIADAGKRGAGYAAADLASGDLPPRPAADLVAAFGLLEFVADLPRFFEHLRRYAVFTVASYYAADDTADLDRAAFGWRNHLTRDALRQMLEAAGLRVVADWAIDGRLSILRLRDAKAGGMEAENARG